MCKSIARESVGNMAEKIVAVGAGGYGVSNKGGVVANEEWEGGGNTIREEQLLRRK